MLLIDAIYINTGGGKILLDYLVEELEKTQIPVFYLLDTRIQDNPYSIKSTNKVQYMDSSLFKRYMFYRKNKNCFSKVLAFGNVPPPIRLKAEVLTYFHGASYIYVSSTDFSLKENFMYLLKRKFIYLSKRNTDKWIVQSPYVKNKMMSLYSEKEEKIDIIPFFKVLKESSLLVDNFEKENHTYLFVSNAYKNKNHLRLINAFCEFYKKHGKGKLILTVSDKFPEITRLINRRIKQGFPIQNIGYVPQDVLIKYYQKSEYIIFPSTSETFGLGLIEGKEFDCKIIAADLPYTYEVCKPSITFNPFLENSIQKALEKTISLDIVEHAEIIIENEIQKIIKVLR
ncbi:MULTISPECIES: glycosyltransferase [Capnocytophaga]|uniref:Glycosyl transferase family 1 n=1 Tax=Capnocytophaga canis TaxID=1848903 RepID=A0A3A1YFG0_9FLAO|nr:MULTISPECIES: glycosyltransferase [Capnocytophaga]ATA74633.1 glycosyl transferase family 1 [Capnocytophaga sp. H2931]RIY35918.1 glycosyl transferase family 1 [Capnocytophaga canis]